LFQIKHNHCLTNPLAVAALWSDEEGRPVLDAALDVYLTRPRHTSRKEVSISFDEVQHKKKERSYVNMVTPVLQVLHSLCSGKDMIRSIVLWHSYRSSASCDREPRSGSDDFVRK